jgi:DNA-binding NarL/FixJ family response regulator
VQLLAWPFSRNAPFGGKMDNPTYSSDTPPTFTRRELEVLQLLAIGKSNKAIADALSITEKTTEFHLGNIYSKIGVNTRAEAIIWAIQSGIVKKN